MFLTTKKTYFQSIFLFSEFKLGVFALLRYRSNFFLHRIFIPADDMLELLMANKEWLENRPKADLARLPENKKTDELDMNGTFKKLQID